MAGRVTYDGVQSERGWNIFEGRSFWIATKVPLRSHIVQLVKDNGGVIVPLEKNADMLIADHARKDTPANSYSWRYVDDSVKNGVAQLEDSYLIRQQSESAASRPRKSTRTPFSKSDDAALAEWVLRHHRDRTGNIIYRDFALTHGRHPWQAWRNRFVKTLANRSDEDLRRLAASARDVVGHHDDTPEHSDLRQASPKSKSTVKTKQGSNSASAGTPPTTQARRREPNMTPQSAPHTTPPVRTSVARARNDAGPLRRRESQVSRGSSSSDDVGSETQVNMRDRFFHALCLFYEENGQRLSEPRVGGEPMNLWDLNQAVESQKVPFDEVDWLKVAEDLDYDISHDQDFTEDLRQCFHTYLADFVETMTKFHASEDESDVSAEEPRKRNLLVPSMIPSSPAVAATYRKRSLDESATSLERCAKRRRPTRTYEIPSTPEQELYSATAQSPSNLKVHEAVRAQETNGGSRQGGSSSPSPTPPSAPDVEEGDLNAEEALSEIHVQAAMPQLVTHQSNVDVIPSQQLRSEALDTSPIPLNLKRRRAGDGAQELPRDTASFRGRVGTGQKTARRSLPASFGPRTGRPRAPPATETSHHVEPQASRANAARGVNSQNLRECVEHYESLGYTRPVVVESLRRTTLTPGWPATLVMEQLQNKGGVPHNVEGVWTDDDDESLAIVDDVEGRGSLASAQQIRKAKRDLARLVDKHTQTGVDLRREFLSQLVKR